MPSTEKAMSPRQFGKWLSLTMDNRSMSGKDLATASQLDAAQISRWRKGRGRPSLESCERLAGALNVDAMRLAVTAGAVPPAMAGVEPLPMPPKGATIEETLKVIRGLTGVTEKSVEGMIEAYKAGLEEE